MQRLPKHYQRSTTKTITVKIEEETYEFKIHKDDSRVLRQMDKSIKPTIHSLVTIEVLKIDGEDEKRLGQLDFDFYDSQYLTALITRGIDLNSRRTPRVKEIARKNAERHDEYNMVWAMYCSLTDGILYDNADSLNDFICDLGYKDVERAIEVYDACRNSWDKWQQLGIDLYELANALRENYEL